MRLCGYRDGNPSESIDPLIGNNRLRRLCIHVVDAHDDVIISIVINSDCEWIVVPPQAAGPMILLTATSRAWRVSGFAITWATPSDWAVLPAVQRSARNWAETPMIGVPGCAARILSATREPACLGISIFAIARSAVRSNGGSHGVTALT